MNEPQKGEKWTVNSTGEEWLVKVITQDELGVIILLGHEGDRGIRLWRMEEFLRNWHRVEPMTCTCGRFRAGALDSRCWHDTQRPGSHISLPMRDEPNAYGIHCPDCHDRLDEAVAVPMMPRLSEEDLEALQDFYNRFAMTVEASGALSRLLAAARREPAQKAVAP